MLVQGLGMLAQIVIVLPVLALAVTALLSDNPLWDWLTLAGGILLGVGLLVAGIRIGGKWLDRGRRNCWPRFPCTNDCGSPAPGPTGGPGVLRWEP